ncbi:M16 family metallopeptidase [Micromonospora sp. DT228]|uniref:M16 family metallopeptidase n=1 Tax=Micromonospora sp. DT228 TaxID=3393443 RepID=UPI003CFA0B23
MSTAARFPIARTRLDNGLRVAVCPDRGVPVVAVNLWYGVGAAHDPAGRSGAAHLCEHLMFDGSRHVRSGEHQLLVHRAGGSGNATTGYDRTNYFTQAPTGALDLVLWLEADRMASAAQGVTPAALDTQRRVIGQEKEQRRAAGPAANGVQAALRELLPAAHPYRRAPIGSVSDLAETTVAEVSDFHGRYYRPANAVLSVVGDVDPDEALGLAHRYFGDVQGVSAAGPADPAPAHGSGPGRAALTGHDLIQYVFLLPADDAATGRDLDAAEIALDVLAGGAYARLYRRLVISGLAAQVTASVSRLAGVSFGTLTARPAPGRDSSALSAAIETAIEDVAQFGPTDAELAIARARLEHGWLLRVGNRIGRADELSRLAWRAGDPGLLNERLPALDAVTVRDVTRAARNWLAVPTTEVAATELVRSAT